jgi:hypothetical protein
VQRERWLQLHILVLYNWILQLFSSVQYCRNLSCKKFFCSATVFEFASPPIPGLALIQLPHPVPVVGKAVKRSSESRPAADSLASSSSSSPSRLPPPFPSSPGVAFSYTVPVSDTMI